MEFVWIVVDKIFTKTSQNFKQMIWDCNYLVVPWGAAADAIKKPLKDRKVAEILSDFQPNNPIEKSVEECALRIPALDSNCLVNASLTNHFEVGGCSSYVH